MLARYGRQLKDMAEYFDPKAAEIRAIFNNQIQPNFMAVIRELVRQALGATVKAG